MAVRILFVEDNELLFQLYYDAFGEDERFFINFVRNGLEALDKIKSTPVDVIVTDIRMPEMGGEEMIRRMREEGVDAPLIITTGYPNDVPPGFVEEMTVARLFVKPVDLSELRDTILEVARTDGD
jgi:CheY-like chemotaxis protein